MEPLPLPASSLPRLPDAKLWRAASADSTDIVSTLAEAHGDAAAAAEAASLPRTDQLHLRDRAPAALLAQQLRSAPVHPPPPPFGRDAPVRAQPLPQPAHEPPARASHDPAAGLDRALAEPLRFAADAARASLAAARPQPALALLDAAWPSVGAPAELLALRAHALLDLGRETECADLVARGLQQTPSSSALRWMGVQAAARLDAPLHAAALALPLIRQVPMVPVPPREDAALSAREPAPQTDDAAPPPQPDFGVPTRARAALREMAELLVAHLAPPAAPPVAQPPSAAPYAVPLREPILVGMAEPPATHHAPAASLDQTAATSAGAATDPPIGPPRTTKSAERTPQTSDAEFEILADDDTSSLADQARDYELASPPSRAPRAAVPARVSSDEAEASTRAPQHDTADAATAPLIDPPAVPPRDRAGRLRPPAPKVSSSAAPTAAHAPAPESKTAPPLRSTMYDVRRTAALEALDQAMPPADRRLREQDAVMPVLRRWLGMPTVPSPPVAPVAPVVPVAASPMPEPAQPAASDLPAPTLALVRMSATDFAIVPWHASSTEADVPEALADQLPCVAANAEHERPDAPTVLEPDVDDRGHARAAQLHGAPEHAEHGTAAELPDSADHASVHEVRGESADTHLPGECRPPFLSPPTDPATLFAWLDVDRRVQPAGLLAAQSRLAAEALMRQQARANAAPLPISWNGLLQLALVGAATVLYAADRHAMATIVLGVAAGWWFGSRRTPP